MTAILLFKLTLVPVLILCTTLIGRKLGPAIAGWVSAFPIVAGPILYFVMLEKGNEFAAAAAASMLLAVVAHLSFGVAYSWASLRWRWPLCLPVALGAYTIAVAALTALDINLVIAMIAVIVLLVVGRKFYPTNVTVKHVHGGPSRLELPLRMVAAALLVLIVTKVSSLVNAKLAGMLAMFPVLGCTLSAFSHRQSGAAFTIALLKNMVTGYYAFGAFCVALTLLLPTNPGAMSFAAASLVALVTQVFTLQFARSDWR